MIATLRFNTDIADEQAEFDRACAAPALCSILSDLDEWMRQETEYGNKDYSYAREKLAELMSDNGIDLARLWF